MTEITKVDNVAIVKLDEAIVASTTGELRKTLKKVLDEGTGGIVIDLINVEMIDSSGLGLLVATHNSLQKVDRNLELNNCNDDLKKLFNNMRLDQHFVINE